MSARPAPCRRCGDTDRFADGADSVCSTCGATRRGEPALVEPNNTDADLERDAFGNRVEHDAGRRVTVRQNGNEWTGTIANGAPGGYRVIPDGAGYGVFVQWCDVSDEVAS